MPHFIYIIKSQVDGRFYKGMSEWPEDRFLSHNAGKVSSTKGYRPWKLVYKEEYSSLKDAREREKFLKTGRGRDFIKSLNL